jgi:hypothetical protein
MARPWPLARDPTCAVGRLAALRARDLSTCNRSRPDHGDPGGLRRGRAGTAGGTGRRPFPAARRFAAALGDGERRSATASPAARRTMVAALAGGWMQVEGGLFHHRNGVPGDGMLRYWTGLMLAAGGRHDIARQEFAAAVATGAATGGRSVALAALGHGRPDGAALP